MKRYIKSTNNISPELLMQTKDMLSCFKHTNFDIDNHRIVVPLYPGAIEDDLMQEGMLGKWLVDNGFDVSFTTGDYEYLTKGRFNARAMRREGAGDKRYLRNRLIMTITW